MPKKRNTSSGAGSTVGMSKWGHVKGGKGGAFKEHSVPVNTKSRKVPSGPNPGSGY